MKVFELLEDSAKIALEMQLSDGSFMQGHNGPWMHKDTQVRVTSHYAQLLCKAYHTSDDSVYKSAAQKAGEFIISQRPHGYTFHCRNSHSKCNGLIGQAWAMEALWQISVATGDLKFARVAGDVIKLHHLSRTGLWHTLEIDGKDLGISRTLNQQVLFSAVSAGIGELLDDAIIKSKVMFFVSHLMRNIVYCGGIFEHLIYRRINFEPLDYPIRFMTRCVAPWFFRKADLVKLRNEYLSFLLYGFALLKKSLPDPSVFSGQTFNRVLQTSVDLLDKDIYTQKSDADNYSWAYNPVGFEVAYVLQEFDVKSRHTAEEWIREQLNRHYDVHNRMMNRATSDPVTLASRIYELIRVDDREV